MRTLIAFLLSCVSVFAQTEKWTYPIPSIAGLVDMVEIVQLRHDSLGNVGMVIRYSSGPNSEEQVRWVGSNGKELGSTVPEFKNAQIISVSKAALLITYVNPNTFEVTLEKVTRKGPGSVSKKTMLGPDDNEVMGLAPPLDSPTQSTFFVVHRESPTVVSLKRYTVR